MHDSIKIFQFAVFEKKNIKMLFKTFCAVLYMTCKIHTHQVISKKELNLQTHTTIEFTLLAIIFRRLQ